MVEQGSDGEDAHGDVDRLGAAEGVRPTDRLVHLVRVELQQQQVAQDQLHDTLLGWNTTNHLSILYHSNRTYKGSKSPNLQCQVKLEMCLKLNDSVDLFSTKPVLDICYFCKQFLFTDTAKDRMTACPPCARLRSDVFVKNRQSLAQS